MGRTLHRISEPEEEIFSLPEVKSFLKEDLSLNDNDIYELSITSREWLEDETGLNFGVSTYELYLNGFTDITIPRYPLDKESVEITYIDKDGNDQTLDTGSYKVIHQEIPCRLIFNSNLPDTKDDELYPVKVVFKAGYTKAKIPKRAHTAMKLLITHYYNHRDLADKRIDYSIPVPARVRHFTDGLKKWRFH